MPSSKKSQDNENLAELRKRIAKAPTSSGIYRWLNKKGDVLYIGKAKNLRSRLKSYVQKPDKSLNPWKQMMLKQIADFDVTVTNTELEALVLETNLIKESKPKYNVLMKDDKSYLYVQISKDPYSAVEIVRRGVAPNTIGFGPFTSSIDIRKTMDMLNSVFPYKACRKSLEALNRAVQKGEDPEKVFDKDSTPCLEYQIGECNGICVGKLQKHQYIDIVKNVEEFLRGNRTPAITAIKEKMLKAASEKKFERALKLRNTLQAIQRMEERQLVSDTSGEDVDIIGIAVVNSKAHVVLFKQRGGKVIDELNFTLAGEAETEEQALAQFLPQYYSESPDIPSIIIIAAEIHGSAGLTTNESPLLENWLKEKKGKKVEIRAAQRGKKSQLLKLAEKNAQEKIKQMETKWETAAKNLDQALEELKVALELAEKPKRIECYDISHLGGTQTVGSMVVAVNGKAANDQYRSFTIRTLREGEIDDYKALSEMLKRRLKYLTQNIREEEKRWKVKGITFGKARKKEVEFLTKTTKEKIDPKNFIISRRADIVISFGSLKEHKGGLMELEHLWSHNKWKNPQLLSLLSRKLLHRVKKGKVYAIMKPEDEQFFGGLGFQYIKEAPKPLQKKSKDRTIMMYAVKEHKDDTSLNAKPNLLVIDGGKGQVSTAVKVLKELDLKIPVIGLAKREEEIFIPGSSHPVSFPKDSQAVFLLMRLRNEAHRFANNLREKKGKKAAIHSALDDVPGIGEKTKKELLERFESVDGVRGASEEELKDVLTGIQVEALKRCLS